MSPVAIPVNEPKIFGDYPNMIGNLTASRGGYGLFGPNSNGPFLVTEGTNSIDVSTATGTANNTASFDASRVSSLYKNGLTEVNVNALYGLNLIKAF